MTYLIFCPNGGLVTRKVACLTAAMFQPLLYSSFGITLSMVPILFSQFVKISVYYMHNYLIISYTYIIL
jgi:hypothetical protein